MFSCLCEDQWALSLGTYICNLEIGLARRGLTRNFLIMILESGTLSIIAMAERRDMVSLKASVFHEVRRWCCQIFWSRRRFLMCEKRDSTVCNWSMGSVVFVSWSCACHATRTTNAPRLSVFNDFEFEITVAPQPRANFADLKFKKLSEPASFWRFWLPNRSRATAWCKFCRHLGQPIHFASLWSHKTMEEHRISRNFYPPNSLMSHTRAVQHLCCQASMLKDLPATRSIVGSWILKFLLVSPIIWFCGLELSSNHFGNHSHGTPSTEAAEDRCEREMEQLAVQNYSAFIGSAEVTQGVKQVGGHRGHGNQYYVRWLSNLSTTTSFENLHWTSVKT